MNRGLRALIGVALLLVTLTAASAATRFRGGNKPIEPIGTLVTTHDYYIPAMSNAPAGGYAPYTFGQPFREGDVPSGSHVAVTDNSSNPLSYQMDSVSTAWPDGSLKWAAFRVLVPASGAGNRFGRLKFILQSGTYSAASTPHSIADISRHNYLVKFDAVKTHPGATAPYHWTTKGSHSGNFTCTLNNFISAGQYRTRANGPVDFEAIVYGQMTDDSGATDPHLYCKVWIDVYNDPSNHGVLYTEIMPLICQPFANPRDGSTVGAADPNADFVIGQASLYDGTTKLRDYADDTLSIATSTVDVSNNKMAYPTGTGTTNVIRRGYRVHLVSGSLPGGLAEGNIGFAEPRSSTGTSPDGLTLSQSNFYSALGNVEYTLTSQGSGRFQLIPLQHMSYYNGFYITQKGDNGLPIWQAGSWSSPVFIQPDLDGTTNNHSTASQKAYWQATGLIPGWDLSLGASVLSMDGAIYNWPDEGPGYAPGSNGPYRTGVDGSGGDFDTDGPFWEAITRYFVRMGATNFSATDYQPVWNGALINATWSSDIMWRMPTGNAPPYLLPFDNGPDNAGASYPSLGAPCPNTRWYPKNTGADNYQCIVVPTDNNVRTVTWAFGPFGYSFSNYHWVPVGPVEYTIFARDYFLDTTKGNGQRVWLQATGSYGNDPRTTRTPTVNGAVYYGAAAFFAADAETIVSRAGAAYLSPAADPDTAYLLHMMTNTANYWSAMYTTQFSATQKAAGVGPIDIYENDDGFNIDYGALGELYSYALSRNVGFGMMARPHITQDAGMADARGNSGLTTWGTAESACCSNWYTPVLGASTTNSGWSGWIISGDPPDPRQYFGPLSGGFGCGFNIAEIHGYFRVPASSGCGFAATYPGIANGDEIFATTQMVTGTANPGFQGPPEMYPGFPVGTKFYIVNLSPTGSPAGCAGDPCFQISTRLGGTPISMSATGAWNNPGTMISNPYFSWRPKTDNGSLVGGTCGVYCMLRKAVLAEAVRMAVPADRTYGESAVQAYNNITTRVPNSRNAICTQMGTGGSIFARICNTTAVPVQPALPSVPN